MQVKFQTIFFMQVNNQKNGGFNSHRYKRIVYGFDFAV